MCLNYSFYVNWRTKYNCTKVKKAVCTLLAEAQPSLDNGLHVVNNKVEDNDVVMASSRDETNNFSAAENNEESGEEGMSLSRCH